MQITLTDGLTETRNHWRWGRGWRPGRRKYYFHLTTEAAPNIRQIAERAQVALGGIEYVDVIAPDLLHLTMTAIGFTDEISPAHLAEVADRVFAAWRRIDRPVVTFDGLLAADEAVMLTATDVPWLMEFSDLQRRVVDEVIGAQQWRPFRPHLSLTYSNDTGPIDPVVEALAPIAGSVGPVSDTFTLTCLSLGKDRQRYEWTTLRRDPA